MEVSCIEDTLVEKPQLVWFFSSAGAKKGRQDTRNATNAIDLPPQKLVHRKS